MDKVEYLSDIIFADGTPTLKKVTASVDIQGVWVRVSEGHPWTWDFYPMRRIHLVRRREEG